MASIQKIPGAKGTAYKVVVTVGRDGTGKQIRKSTTWKPDRPMTAKQAEKEARQFAADFEKQLEQGFAADDKQTFEEYALYTLDLRYKSGLITLSTRQLHERKLRIRAFPVIGHMRLRDIKPQTLTSLYLDMAKPGARKKGVYVTAKPSFQKLMEESPLNMKQIAKEIGMCYDSLWKMKQTGKHTKPECAAVVAKYFGRPLESLFEIHGEGSTLSTSYILDTHRVISSILSQAVKEMILTFNPASRATVPIEDNHAPNYFQPEQIGDILDALETEPIMWRTMINLFIVTGCRRGEIAGLKWRNVNFEGKQILIDCSLKVNEDTKEIYEGATKTKKKRYVNIPSEMVSLLKKYRVWQMEERLKTGDRWTESDYVFTHENGEMMAPTCIYTWLYRFSRRHGLPHINPHAFRHTAASILISEGVDIVTVSKLLGHSKPSTTADIYAHAVEGAQRKATECLTDILIRKEKKA